MAAFARVLVTGGSGFVGRYLAPELRRICAADAVCGMVVFTEGEQVPGWKPWPADITKADAIAAVVADIRPDLVVHLAAQASPGDARRMAAQTWRINAVGALNLASALALHAPDATVLNVSTSEVYGRQFSRTVVSESTPMEPANVYASSKAAAEQIFTDVLAPTTRLITVRPLNHIGAGQDERFALSSFAAQIARIETGQQAPEIRVGNLDVSRDFLDVRDVVSAYIALLSDAQRLPLRAVYNIASGQSYRLRDLLDIMIAQSTARIAVIPDPSRIRGDEVPSVRGNSDLLQQATGWRPQHAIADTLVWLLADWRQRVARTTG